MDISNGSNVGCSLFVQGCPFMCYNCFNSETWDFNGGKEWTEETKKEFLELIDRPYIKRVSILGGEPLAEQNLDGVLDLITAIREKYPISENTDSANPCKMGVSEVENSDKIRVFSDKTIWLYSGYTWESIINWKTPFDNVMTANNGLINADYNMFRRKQILQNIDVLVDGQYIDSQKDLTLKYRGSKNQRVINIQQSLQQNKIILYCD